MSGYGYGKVRGIFHSANLALRHTIPFIQLVQLDPFLGRVLRSA